jgi:hypothetical protein
MYECSVYQQRLVYSSTNVQLLVSPLTLPSDTHTPHTFHYPHTPTTHTHTHTLASTHVYTGAFDVKRGLIRKSSERTGGIYINPAPVLGGLALPKRQWTLDLWMNLGTERTPRAKSSSGCVCNIQYSQHLHVMMALILLSNTVCSLSFYFSSP